MFNYFYVFERLILITNKRSFKALDFETIFCIFLREEIIIKVLDLETISMIFDKKKKLVMSWFYLGFCLLTFNLTLLKKSDYR